MTSYDEHVAFFESSEFLSAYAYILHSYSLPLSPTQILQLRSQYPSFSIDKLRLLLDIVAGHQLNQRQQKLPTDWLSTPHLLEQATAMLIAEHHATRFDGCHTVLEVCTGTASDTMSLARHVEFVQSFEADAMAAALATVNLRRSTISNVVVSHTDILNANIDYHNYDAMWADPARRTEERRLSTVTSHYRPPLEYLMNLPVRDIMGIKISPAVTVDCPKGWVREWIGYGKECKEQVLWRNSSVAEGCVSLVDKQLSWAPDLGISNYTEVVSWDDISKGFFLYDPHAALVRSGFLAAFYREQDINVLDTRIAYGISAHLIEHPFLQTFVIQEIHPFSIKVLRRRITELQWNSRTEIKKRGVAQLPEDIRKQLRFCESDIWGTVVLTRVGDKPFMFLCSRYQNSIQA